MITPREVLIDITVRRALPYLFMRTHASKRGARDIPAVTDADVRLVHQHWAAAFARTRGYLFMPSRTHDADIAGVTNIDGFEKLP